MRKSYQQPGNAFDRMIADERSGKLAAWRRRTAPKRSKPNPPPRKQHRREPPRIGRGIPRYTAETLPPLTERPPLIYLVPPYTFKKHPAPGILRPG